MFKVSSIDCVWNAGAMLGESPLWVAHEQALYWIDIKAPAIHRYDPDTRAKHHWPVSEQIGCLVYRQGVGFLAALQSGFAHIEFGNNGEPVKTKPIFDPETNLPGNRFNDGKLDPAGRFWAGTMDDAECKTTGSWWQLDLNNQVHKIDCGYKVTNGPAFDMARGRVYLTDSAAQTIFVARMTESGMIADKRVFRQFGKGDGYPDGMTTDRKGNVWVAFWDGACIRCFSPDAALEQEITMPIPRPTSMTFNPDATGLYVTSARIGLPAKALESAPLSGGLFFLEGD